MSTAGQDPRIAEAMDRVLAAERDAASAVQAARASAEARRAAAEAAGSRILDRARERATRLHELMQRRLAHALDQLEASAGAERAHAPDLRGVADLAARQVAQALTGSADEPA